MKHGSNTDLLYPCSSVAVRANPALRLLSISMGYWPQQCQEIGITGGKGRRSFMSE
jgi:hypothetical protein